MWRRTERANLEKKPSTRLSQEPCLGVPVSRSIPANRLKRAVEGDVAAELERRDTWLSDYSPSVSLRSAWNNYPDGKTVKGNVEGNV